MQFLYSRSTTIWSLLALLFVVCVAPGPARAEKGVVTPSISAKTTYNDNVHFKKKTDFEWLLVPAVKVDYGQEDWTLSTGARANVYRYSDLNQYDRENYNFWLDGEKDITETLQINFRSSFSYDHTFEDELTESGNVTSQALRRRYSLSPGVSWGMTEKDNLTLTLPYSQTVYTGSSNADSVSKGGTLGWSHVMNNERVSLLGQFSLTNYYFDRTDGYTDQDVYNLMGGMHYKPSELFDITAYFGLGHARSDVTFRTLQDTTGANTYFSFDLAGTYHREKWEFTLGADRQASPSTDGEVTVRTRMKLSGKYSFTERLSSAVETAYFQTESGGLISESKKRTYYVHPWIGYKWTENASIRLEFRHTNNKNLLTDKEQKQNQTALRFEYRYPWFF
ncbi:outer membrane beta-barrel protein [Pseudodesulfovibrio portus]|uniref:Outer membrane beta-barrel protein n=1 Tax=Pseudodesulfovibrio portus TaxID=231439 RepID=A0ABN6RUR8_9BACT|nr:outer membrane beta-barrel protein [Pseudodesulfovibrio portus]BDQ33463.1 hypothetical protein JCM14722_10050 [Pseudodesulfovibrio portus]